MINLHPTRQRVEARIAYVENRPVRGYVVNTETNQVGWVIERSKYSVAVSYPQSYIDKDGQMRFYLVVGDVWFDHRPAMQSDAALYNHTAWVEANEAALTTATNAVASA